MKRIVLTALLGFVFLANLFASDPGVVISGVEGNYSIGTFAKGSVVFLNRTMTFGDIPEQFDGWQFTQINAYSTWNGGPGPELVAKPKSDGYLYCIVDISLQESIVDPWAEANGWNKIDGVEISYGANASQKFYAYRKECVANQEITIVEPATFSRCIIIAPKLMEAGSEEYFAPDLTVTGAEGKYVIGDFAQGATVFLNRTMTFGAIPEQFQGWKFTQINAYSSYNGGPSPELVVKPKEDGYLYCIVDISVQENVVDPWAEANGWNKIDGVEISYGANASQKFYAYRKECVANQEITIVEPATFSRCIIIAPAMAEPEPVYFAPDLTITGAEGNYVIGDFAQGSTVFLNRTITFGAIPEQFQGWKYTKINAFSSYNGGPSPELVVTPTEDGYIYCIVDIEKQNEVVVPWAAANGWTQIEGIVISYGANANQKFYAYRKECVADQEITIVEPATFSRCIIIAPEMTEATPVVTYDAVPIDIKVKGWMETQVFENGATAFANRTFVYHSAKAGLSGLYVTRYNGGAAPQLTITAQADGDMYIAQCTTQTDEYNVAANGWTAVTDDDFDLKYNDGTNTPFKLYKRAVTSGETIQINSTAWAGILVFGSAITYSFLSDIDAVAVEITSSGWMETDVLDVGTKAFGNRNFTYHSINSDLIGLYITRYNGGAVPRLTVKALETGDMYIAQSTASTLPDQYNVIENGWTKVFNADYDFKYNDGANTPFTVYKRAVTAGQQIELNSTSWAGIRVLSSDAIIYHIGLVDDADNSTTLNALNSIKTNIMLCGRTLYKDNEWNTLCLPFNLTLAGSPLQDATVKELTSSTFSNGTLTLNFTDATSIEAGKPYIVKWASGDNLVNPAFEGVTVNKTPTNVTTDIVTFCSTYAPVSFDTENHSVLIMGENSKLFYPDGLDHTYVNAFRGYFQLAEGYGAGEPNSNVKSIVVNIDEEATAITPMEAPQQGDQRVYDLTGRRVLHPAKGIYIQNGKKVYLK